MSLGQPRREKDKSGGECWAAEVAINSVWFESRMKSSSVFTGFVITVAIEGLADKYGEEARLDRQGWTILKNKKAMGEMLPAHRIQQRASSKIETIKESGRGESKAVTKAGADKKTLDVKPQTQVSDRGASASASASETVTEIQPEFYCVAEPNTVKPTHLGLTVNLPGVRSGREITLDVGEDRVVVGSRRPPYLLDIFLPYCLQPGLTQANFVTEQNKLEIRLSVK